MSRSYHKMDSGAMNLINKKKVLSLIKQKQKISRSEITQKTGLTPPSVSRIVDSLVQRDRLVEYTGVQTVKSGRPPVVVRFKGETNYIIGIDLGAVYIRGCLVDLKGNFITEIQMPTEIDKGFHSIIKKIRQLVEKFRQREGRQAKIWGVGIGMAGLVNKKTGVIEFSPDFGWNEIDMTRELQEKISLPFFYDNSTRLMALGELDFGSIPNLQNFAVVNVGYGIAAGLVIDGKIVRGKNGYAGEFGHIPVSTQKHVTCHCGKTDCLEALASGSRIAILGRQEMEKGHSEALRKLSGNAPEKITAELVGKAARQGDPVSLNIYHEATEYLCRGIGMLANLFNPQVIFIGGGVALSGQFFFDLIRYKLPYYILSAESNLEILPTTFEEHATSMGAVSLVFDKIMNLEL